MKQKAVQNLKFLEGTLIFEGLTGKVARLDNGVYRVDSQALSREGFYGTVYKEVEGQEETPKFYVGEIPKLDETIFRVVEIDSEHDTFILKEERSPVSRREALKLERTYETFYEDSSEDVLDILGYQDEDEDEEDEWVDLDYIMRHQKW